MHGTSIEILLRCSKPGSALYFLDMDVDECDKKRYEYIDDLTDLERQFAILREQ